jgi:hypothetical protein
MGLSKPKAPPVIGQVMHDIYGRSPRNWWRLFNPEWVIPAGKNFKSGDPYGEAKRRIINAQKFHQKIKNLYHPVTYASYGHDTTQLSYGSVTWRAHTADLAPHGDPLSWTLESEDAEGKLVVRTQINTLLTLELEPPIDAGDQTVPAKESAEAVRGTLFRQSGYEHQDSYKNDHVLATTLYSIIKIANTATWWDQ